MSPSSEASDWGAAGVTVGSYLDSNAGSVSHLLDREIVKLETNSSERGDGEHWEIGEIAR